jgi:hypothetical protein
MRARCCHRLVCGRGNFGQLLRIALVVEALIGLIDRDAPREAFVRSPHISSTTTICNPSVPTMASRLAGHIFFLRGTASSSATTSAVRAGVRAKSSCIKKCQSYQIYNSLSGGRGVNRRALEKLRYFRFSCLIPRTLPRRKNMVDLAQALTAYQGALLSTPPIGCRIVRRPWQPANVSRTDCETESAMVKKAKKAAAKLTSRIDPAGGFGKAARWKWSVLRGTRMLLSGTVTGALNKKPTTK